VDVTASGTAIGADVLIDGEIYGKAPIRLQIPVGQHNVSVRKYLYKNYDQQINVIAGETISISPNLVLGFAENTLRVNTEAEIYLDGQLVGIREWSGPIEFGKHRVECRQMNHRSSYKDIEVSAYSEKVVILDDPDPIFGSLEVDSSVLGAEVSSNGRVIGTTPLRLTNSVPIGESKITVYKKGYRMEEKTVIIEEGKTLSLSFNLTAIADIVVDSKPQHAKLAINGKPVGETPYSTTLETGEYSIDIAAQGFNTIHSMFVVDGSDKTYSYNLVRQFMQPSAYYLSAGYQLGGVAGVSAQIGGFFGGFNVEGFFGMSLTESEPIYWNSPTTMIRPTSYTYKGMSFGGKVGYSLIFGPRLRLTPQVGVGIVQIKGALKDSGDKDPGATDGYCVPALVDARVDFALAPSIALTVIPGFSYAVTKSDVYSKVAEASKTVGAYGTGVSLMAGLCLFF
jgi:hypothetical protein